MVYQMELWMSSVKPFRFLPAGDKMYLIDPRGDFFYSAEPIMEQVVVAVAAVGVGVICAGSNLFQVLIPFLFFLPLRIVSVNP